MITVNITDVNTRNIGARLYSIASDSESRREKALHLTTNLTESPDAFPPHCLFRDMKLFSRWVRRHGETSYKGYIHVFKRERDWMIHTSRFGVMRVVIIPGILLKSGTNRIFGEAARDSL